MDDPTKKRGRKSLPLEQRVSVRSVSLAPELWQALEREVNEGRARSVSEANAKLLRQALLHLQAKVS